MTMPRFHLAFPVINLEQTRAFYCTLLGCTVGRSSDRWIDFNFYGHQLTAHLAPDSALSTTNPVDGEDVPVRHFGVILEWEAWQQLADRLKTQNLTFVIQPQIRFRGEVGEQATLFVQDPSGNALEFKSFKDASQIFASV